MSLRVKCKVEQVSQSPGTEPVLSKGKLPSLLITLGPLLGDTVESVTKAHPVGLWGGGDESPPPRPAQGEWD